MSGRARKKTSPQLFGASDYLAPGVLNDMKKSIALIGPVNMIYDHNQRKKQMETVNTTKSESAGLQMLKLLTTMSIALTTNNHRDKRQTITALIISSIPPNPSKLTSVQKDRSTGSIVSK